MSYYIAPCGNFVSNTNQGCATFELLDIREYSDGKKQAIITEPDGIQYFGLLDMHGKKPTMGWDIIWPWAEKQDEVDGNIKDEKNVGGYPSYVVVDANGTTEVIEHRNSGDVFYINDDPVVRATLGLVTGSKGQPSKQSTNLIPLSSQTTPIHPPTSAEYTLSN
jgi:hypothetical protein